MRAADLIASTDAQSHRDRTRTIITRARSLSPADADALAAELAAGTRYSRELGLLVARHARRYAAVLAVADVDADADLRAVASFVLPSFAEFEVGTALALHGAASAVERHALLLGVLRSPRQDLADAFVEVEVAAHRLGAAARLLSVASPAVVERRVDVLAPQLGTARRFAARHPLAFLDHASRELDALPPTARTTWWARRADAVDAALSMATAERVFALAERRPPASGWQRPHARLLGALVRLDADRAIGLARADGAVNVTGVLGRRALRSLVESGSEAVTGLASAMVTANQTDYRRLVLAGSPPARRALIAGVAQRTGVVAFGTLELDRATPDALRFARAREEVARAEANGEPVWAAASRLPIDEGEPRLRELLQSSLATDRAMGYGRLVELVGFSRDPERLGRLLASFTRLPNEQEPVRIVAVQALCCVPVRVFGPAALPAVRALVADAYRAPDSSFGITSQLRSLAVRLLRLPGAPPEVRELAIRLLVDAPGPFHLPPLQELSPAAATAVTAAFLPLIDEHRGIARFDVLIELARALGRRARGSEPIASRLAALARSRDQGVARQAITLWLEDPVRRAERTRELLAADRSAVTLPEVERIVGSTATELLTPRVLAGRVAGRFHERGAVWMPPARWSHRWTEQQRRLTGERLIAVASRATQEVWLQVRAVALAAMVPGFGRDILLSEVGRTETPIADRALAGLGGFGADARVDAVLVPALGDDRARIAGPAAVRRSGLLRPVELASFVKDAVLAGPKLTSRKALLFAVSRSRLADPWPLVDAVLSGRPGPDLRVAAVSVALRRFGDPLARELVQRFLADSTRIAALVSSLDVTRVGASERAEFADLVGRLADTDDQAVREGAVRVAVRWVAFSESLRAVLWGLVVDLDRPTTMAAEALAVRAMVDDGHPDGLVGAIRTLLELAGAESVEQPRARRRIEAVVAALARFAPSPMDAAATAALTTTTEALTAVDVHGIDAARLALRLVAEDPIPEDTAAEDTAAGDSAVREPAQLLARALADRPAVAALVVELAWTAAADADRLRSRLLASVPSLARAGEAQQVVAVAVLARLRMAGPLPEPWLGILHSVRRSPHLEARERALRVAD